MAYNFVILDNSEGWGSMRPGVNLLLLDKRHSEATVEVSSSCGYSDSDLRYLVRTSLASLKCNLGRLPCG